MGPWCLCQIDRLMRNKYTPLERVLLGMGVSPRVLTCGRVYPQGFRPAGAYRKF